MQLLIALECGLERPHVPLDNLEMPALADAIAEKITHHILIPPKAVRALFHLHQACLLVRGIKQFMPAFEVLRQVNQVREVEVSLQDAAELLDEFLLLQVQHLVVLSLFCSRNRYRVEYHDANLFDVEHRTFVDNAHQISILDVHHRALTVDLDHAYHPVD
jgi:hypothetical protein